jgi:arylsulfate sulfotransferase
MMRKKIGYILLILCWVSCKKEEEAQITLPAPEPRSVISDTLILNPSGFAPLTARLFRSTPPGSSLELTLLPRYGNSSPLVIHSENEQRHVVDILGLYPNHNNLLEIKTLDKNGILQARDTLVIKTASLPAGMPSIRVRIASQEREAGMTLVSYWGMNSPQVPFIFDEKGEIRWYLDYSNHPVLKQLAYDNGIERLRNGNYYFGDKNSNMIYEVDYFGEVVDQWSLGGYVFHHHVKEKADGNFLVTVSSPGSRHLNGSPTIEDYIIEIDRQSGTILNSWDLKNSLDEYRSTWTGQFSATEVDWFHANAVIPDGKQHIIVSGRTQGIVKLDKQQQLSWIIATHNDWDSSRTGEPENFLLQPLDANGNAIQDTALLNGTANHRDFEWPWYPHAPKLLPGGDLLVFDNGDNRNYSNVQQYSRAVVYRINEQQMTIQQLWSYGKQRGHETFGQYVSDVDYLPQTGNILFSPGFSTDNNGMPGGRIVEVTYPGKKVVFEAEITPDNGSFVTFHRAERLSLYPPL